MRFLCMLFLATLTSQLASQSDPGSPHPESEIGNREFRGCRAPRQHVGLISGSGNVSFVLDDNGNPDTASIQVFSVSHVSPSGLRSALARLMVRCRFTAGKLAGRGVATLLYREVTLDSTRLSFRDPSNSAGQPLPTTPPAITAGAEYNVNDPQIEERPRPCKFTNTGGVGMPDTRPINPSSEQEVLERMERNRERNSGIVQVAYTIADDGRVDASTYAVISSTNNLLLPQAKNMVLGCHYDPARIAGTPIRTRVIWTITFGSPARDGMR
jgi:hypothetical protein